jgi:hypothetical protein
MAVGIPFVRMRLAATVAKCQHKGHHRWRNIAITLIAPIGQSLSECNRLLTTVTYG